MIQRQFFRVFQLFAPEVINISIRKTLGRIRKSYSFRENDLKHEITWAKNLFRKESKLPMSFEQFVSFVASLLKKLLLFFII